MAGEGGVAVKAEGEDMPRSRVGVRGERLSLSSSLEPRREGGILTSGLRSGDPGPEVSDINLLLFPLELKFLITGAPLKRDGLAKAGVFSVPPGVTTGLPLGEEE